MRLLLNITSNPLKEKLFLAVYGCDENTLMDILFQNYNLKWIKDSHVLDKTMRLEQMGYDLTTEEKEDPVKYCTDNMLDDPCDNIKLHFHFSTRQLILWQCDKRWTGFTHLGKM